MKHELFLGEGWVEQIRVAETRLSLPPYLITRYLKRHVNI